MSDVAIVHICSFYWTSSVHERLFEQLYRVTGFTQIVVVPVKPCDVKTDVEAVPFGSVHQLPCLNIKTSLSSHYRGYATLRALADTEAMNTITRNEVVMVHAHSAYMDGFAAAQLARQLNAPYTLSFRMTDTDFCFRYRHIATWSMRRLAARASQLLTISRGDVRRVADRLALDDSRVLCLGSGVDDYCIDNSLTRKPPRPEPNLCFLTTGKHRYAYKRVDLTIQACESVAIEQKDDAWVIRILGMTRKEYMATYGQAVSSTVLDNHVEFLGRIESRQQVLRLMHDSTLFVLPSRETFGISFLEAISQCTAVVYLKHYAVDSVFDEGYIGVAADSQTLESVSTAVHSALARSKGVLGPFDKNPVCDHSWRQLAHRYVSHVLKHTVPTSHNAALDTTKPH